MKQNGTTRKLPGPRKRKATSIACKLDRLSAGAKPRVLDLFAGCGGLSLGFQRVGCDIAAAVENDADAAWSHGLNFHNGADAFAQARDITKISPNDLTKDLDLGPASAAFDIIVGGPPCQAFARVGRSKLREVAEHPEAFRHDPRSRLYIHYLDYVKVCQPLAVVLENVPDMLNFAGHNIAHEVCEVLSELGYVCGYTLLNAALYGVPQMRERAFLVAVHHTIADAVAFPEPTHWIALPSGYDGSRAVALKLLSRSDTHGPDQFYQTSPAAYPDLPRAITTEEALADLPPIDARAELASGRLKRGARRFDKHLPFPRPGTMSAYAELMRDWPSFEAGETLTDHVIRYLPRDYALFARLSPGDQPPDAPCAAHLSGETRVLGISSSRRGNSPVAHRRT